MSTDKTEKLQTIKTPRVFRVGRKGGWGKGGYDICCVQLVSAPPPGLFLDMVAPGAGRRRGNELHELIPYPPLLSPPFVQPDIRPLEAASQPPDRQKTIRDEEPAPGTWSKAQGPTSRPIVTSGERVVVILL